jgi:hypothetical protein
MAKLLVSANAEGEIITWGEEFQGGVEIPQAEIPSDWEIFRTTKYLFDGTALVVRAGWVDPVISDEPEVPAEPESEPEPETPADPE